MLSSPIGYIDSFLNRITMYRLMLYYLIFLVAFASLLGSFGLIAYNFRDLLISTVISLTVGYVSNYLFSKIFKAQTNIESVFITSLILVLIMPVSFPKDSVLLVLASFIAMAAKYILAFKKRHIFNPAAVSAVIMGVFLGYPASWWIGSATMFPLIFLGGLLILRKTQREKMALGFVGIFLLILGLGTLFTTRSLEAALLTWRISIFDSSLLFFAFVMLIEPLTTPTNKKLRGYYGYIVAFLYSTSQLGLVGFALTAEVSLCIGNIFAFFTNPNYRLLLILKSKKKLSDNVYEFVFNKPSYFSFSPGQYMEWTLSHKRTDSRGNRRYFTISSSPTENEIALTTKFYDPSSSFKKELLSLAQGKKITAAQLAGGFTLPKNLTINTPLAFIAGGVGITPFRSMVKYIIDNNFKADIILIYLNKNKDEIIFSDIFEKAKQNGVKTIYFLTDQSGHINEEKIKELVGDFSKRIFYISGPQLMVRNFEKMLVNIGIYKNKIKTDFFPGYSDK